ncbi:MAG: Lrp/AsnC family transcriptional regulator [Pseudomonadota bacterium]
MQETLDRFDQALLRALQRNGALTNADLAETVGLSASQCSRRRARLEAEGVILGYHAQLNAVAIGHNIRAFVRVNLRSHSKEGARDFDRLVTTNPLIVEAVSVSGDADYVLSVACDTLETFAAFIHETLLPHDNIAQVRSELVLRDQKKRHG